MNAKQAIDQLKPQEWAATPAIERLHLLEEVRENMKTYAGELAAADAKMKNDRMGALPTIRAATDPEATGGQYYGPGGFMEQRGYPVVVTSNDASQNEADARQLWEVSEELTGVTFDSLHQAEAQ